MRITLVCFLLAGALNLVAPCTAVAQEDSKAADNLLEELEEVSAVDWNRTKKTNTNFQKLAETIRILEARIAELRSDEERWPAGGYCVLKYGSCPADFVVREGSLRAIEMYRGNPPHLQPVDFGDSHIKKYATKASGSEPGSHGELKLALCCKHQ